MDQDFAPRIEIGGVTDADGNETYEYVIDLYAPSLDEVTPIQCKYEQFLRGFFTPPYPQDVVDKRGDVIEAYPKSREDIYKATTFPKVQEFLLSVVQYEMEKLLFKDQPMHVLPFAKSEMNATQLAKLQVICYQYMIPDVVVQTLVESEDFMGNGDESDG